MLEEELLAECRKVWATDIQVRNDVDKFYKIYRSYVQTIKDLDCAIIAFDEGRSETNKFVKEFYHEALRYLNEMRKLTQKIKNKILIEFVKDEVINFKEYKIHFKENKRYIR